MGSAIKLLGVEGKKVSIIPTTRGMNLTELYSKKEGLNGYMGAILYDKGWKKYVLVDLDKDFQMSRECINEAFDMVEEYWKKHEVVGGYLKLSALVKANSSPKKNT